MSIKDDAAVRREAASEVRPILAVSGYDSEQAEQDLEPYLSGWLTVDEMSAQLREMYQCLDDGSALDERSAGL